MEILEDPSDEFSANIHHVGWTAQTVGALARSCDLEIEIVDWLAEGSSELTVIKKLTTLADQNVALCSHGDVIPEVIRRLEVQGMAINGERGWKKGALWAIRMNGRSPESAEYIQP